jgi:hypothetical protein
VTAVDLLLETARLGLRLDVRDGTLGVRPAGKLPPDLKAQAAAEKPALVELLSDPRRAAAQAWEVAMSDISDRWDGHATAARTSGRNPAWLDDESLTEAIREAIVASKDSSSLGKALEAINAWRAAWLTLLDSQGSSRP